MASFGEARDIGEIVRWHGVTYAREHGFDTEFEGYVAAKLGTPVADAEVELRRWVREQAVSRTRHRHGRLLD